MVKVIDVFAGPGGLNEGFSHVRTREGDPFFEIAGSFEVDDWAVKTLRLRAAARAVGLLGNAAYRKFMNGETTRAALQNDAEFARALDETSDHVFGLRLGEATRHESDEIIRHKIAGSEPWVLIGGPPCQAYSLVGRARMGAGTEKFLQDERHFLFQEYLHILEEHRPTVFVMENVKGLLSATHNGTQMFERIMSDLSCGGAYEIRSLVVPGDDLQPRDFVIRSERYGVPQKRHRVILLGLRTDSNLGAHLPLKPTELLSVRNAVGLDLPEVRSRISPISSDDVSLWLEARDRGFELAVTELNGAAAKKMALDGRAPETADAVAPYRAARPDGPLMEWLRPDGLERVTLHEPRSHMPADLKRYAYLATLAQVSLHPKVKQMPPELWPKHANLQMETTPFVDRFKAQSWSGPSSTIVSHISKDGHHFIHPDPWQMRSFTVREAARLQTFPDDYFFEGNRTQQYHQVGNAVPPRLAFQIGEVVAELLGR